jgi:hypothetical protein
LKTEPVMARPPSLLYRASKFVRKFRAALIAAALRRHRFDRPLDGNPGSKRRPSDCASAIDDAELLQNVVHHAAESAIARETDRSWNAAVANDESVRRTLEAVVYAPNVTDAAICDPTGQVVVAADRAATECPSGHPVNELASANVLTLLRGTVTIDYVLSAPLNVPNGEAASIRVQLNQMLIAQSVSAALRQAVASLVSQIAAVALIVMAVAWLVFRTD